MEFVSEYGIFLAKAVTIVVAILVVVGTIANLGQRVRSERSGHVEVRRINRDLEARGWALKEALLEPEALKQENKRWKKAEKQRHKEAAKAQKAAVAAGEEAPETRPRVFVLDFHGDIRASAVSSLREEITSVLSLASAEDEILVRLESPGGMVHSYGLAASQLARVRSAGIPLTVCVDKVAASGGYMMACVADRIVAAPFAVTGSIGVVAQIPNFHRLLRKHDIDYELLTAGEYKRTLTVFGENTDKGRAKFMEDLEDTHALFKEFIAENRPSVDVENVATGEVWFGTRALDRGLVDEIRTSDEVLVERCKAADVFEVSWVEKKSLPEKLGLAVEQAADRLILSWLQRLQSLRFFS